MTVEVTPSKPDHEDHPYGEGTVRKLLREPATATVTFAYWGQVQAAMRDWAAGEKFHDMVDVTADGDDETRRVDPENIKFILKGHNGE